MCGQWRVAALFVALLVEAGAVVVLFGIASGRSRELLDRARRRNVHISGTSNTVSTDDTLKARGSTDAPTTREGRFAQLEGRVAQLEGRTTQLEAAVRTQRDKLRTLKGDLATVRSLVDQSESRLRAAFTNQLDEQERVAAAVEHPMQVLTAWAASLLAIAVLIQIVFLLACG